MNATIETAPEAAPAAKRRRILLLIALIFIVLGALWALFFVLVLAKRERTDDAYVNGNKVVISAQVSGTVIAVLTTTPNSSRRVRCWCASIRSTPKPDSHAARVRSDKPCVRCVRSVRRRSNTIR